MNRIQLYIFMRAAKAFLLTVSVLIGIVWLTQALQQLDLMTNKGQSIVIFLQITWLVLPKFVAFIAPVAVLIATIFTLNTLNNDSELVIITNSGASPYLVIKPLLFLALLVALVDASIAHYFSPKAQREVRSFFTEINSDLISSIIKPGEFASIDKGITFYVGARDGNGIFKNVFVADNREKEQSLAYLANSGIITRTTKGTFFVLQDGTIHRRPKDRGSISIIDYSSYAFDLSTFQRALPDQLQYNKPSENFTPYLMAIDQNNSLFVEAPGRFFGELHGRFSDPLYSIAYVFIAFFFLGRAQTTRQGRSLGILSAFIMVLIIRGAGVAAQSSADKFLLANYIQYLLPLGTIVVCAFFISRQIEPVIVQNIAHRLDGLLKSIKQKLGLTKRPQETLS